MQKKAAAYIVVAFLRFPQRRNGMYRTEEFKNRTTMKEYLKNYMTGEGFLEYCEKSTGYDQIWSCPLYDFNPAAYGKKYKYLYIIGRRIIFEQAAENVQKGKDKGKIKEEQKELERYINAICLKEKDILAKKVKTLKKRYPDSFRLPAGAVMCAADANGLKEEAAAILMKYAVL